MQPDPRDALPEAVALARKLYAEGVTVQAILAQTGFALGTLYYWLDGGPQDGGPRLPPIPRRRQTLGRRRRPLKTDRISLVARLWRTAERQVRDIEQRLALNQQPAAERERDARLLAVLVKTLRELSAFDETHSTQADDEDDDPVPRDIDEFRRELARRIHAFVGERTGNPVPGDAADELA